MGHRFLAYLSTLLWVVTICAASFLYLSGHLDLNSHLIEVVKNEICKESDLGCSTPPDAIRIAVSLGRLDLIATVLAILGAVFAVSAIFSLLYVKEKAEIEARATAEKVTNDTLEKLIPEFTDQLVRAKNKMMSDAMAELEARLDEKSPRIQVMSSFFSDLEKDVGDLIASNYEGDSNGD